MPAYITGTGAAAGVACRGGDDPAVAAILSDDALALLGALTRRFRARLDDLLAERARRRERLAAGATLDFLPETRSIREVPWRVAPAPPDLRRRTVEITGPVDRKMIINALNSGADVFMADFEDATAPTWANVVLGQAHLRDAVRRTIAWDDPATGKAYRLGDAPATLVVRPRGLHLTEVHATVDGRPVPGALFDFALYFAHNARALVERGSGPYFYLPKLESHLEARWWNDVFCCAQELVGLPHGTVRATVLIETLPAAFEMDEILHELRDHAAGLNCGRWDYIFSFIKTRRHDPAALLPDRAQVTMLQPCMRAYARLAIRTCHRRGAHAMGGMAANLPIRDDPEAHARALERVRADKLREARDGHDGTWVAHPALVAVAREAFAAHVQGDAQLHVVPENHIGAADLLRTPTGTRTEAGLRTNVRVGLRYLESWLGGTGAVPIDNLMEDVATAEISRAQLWQWLHHAAALDDGRVVTPALVRELLDDEYRRLAAAHEAGPAARDRLADARELLWQVATAEPMVEFLTLVAYPQLVRDTARAASTAAPTTMPTTAPDDGGHVSLALGA